MPRLGVASLVLVFLGSVALANNVPLAKVTRAQGSVEFSRHGESWREVVGTKYLFEGYRVRTGSSSSAEVIDRASGRARVLGANSIIAILDSAVALVSGELSAPGEARGDVWEALEEQFATAHEHTRVRRGPRRDEPVKVATSGAITVSQTYPELVWENVGAGYGYRLVVDDDAFDVPIASSEEMIRFALPDLSPGDHTFMVQVMLEGEVIYTPRVKSTLRWLSAEENREYLRAEKELRVDSDDDAFVVAQFMEARDFLVPAMDSYRSHFQSYREDNDMRPLLIKAYDDLMLFDLKHKEAIAYNAILAAED